MKLGSIEVSKFYLGVKLSKEELPNGIKTYARNSSKYIQDSIANLERKMSERCLKLRSNIRDPLSNNHCSKQDASLELKIEDGTWY